MAEWKTDTEEVKRVVKACRDFKKSLQEEKCGGFIKDLDRYAREIQMERRKIEMQLQGAREELRRAKKERRGFWGIAAEIGKAVCNTVSGVIPPAKLGAEACNKALNLMDGNIEKWEWNVDLLERAFEIYSNQARASRDLVEGSWEGVKSRLGFYTDRHQEFIKRSGQASAAIDEKYDIAPPESLKERDFESPTIFNSANKKVCDERLKDLREDFSFSLYAELKDKISASSKSDCATTSKEHGWDLMSVGIESLTPAKKHCTKNIKKALHDFTEKVKKTPNDLNALNEAFDQLETELEGFTENLSQKIAPVLERYETYKQRALDYSEFLESKKEGFIADEKNPYPEEVKFNELRLAEFDSVFSVIVPLENLSKTACTHHALKALQATDKDLGFDAIELEQIAKGFIPRGYLWHFDANILGNVALVREELLLGVKHTKGYSLWKQFLQTQN
ncbi:HNH endonuclease [Helicobacter pylori]|uniref:HNH endonuclease n=1 Tax=Helicobacter pylori TaxID=210 RepID=UPI000415CDC2|nr:HNH endonuclease [Helicobacter pylori]